MAVIIQHFGEIDVVNNSSVVSAQVNNVAQLAQSKVYQVRDKNNELNPFAGGSLVQWKGRGIQEVQNDIVMFNGTIQAIAKKDDILEIRAEEPLVTFLTFSTDASQPVIGFKVDGEHYKGNSKINLDDASQVMQYARIIFDGSENEYLINEINGNTITIDPALYDDVSDNSDVRIFNPSIVTGAKALKEAFKTTRIGDRLGSSFDSYDQQDQLNNYYLYNNVRPIDNMPLRNYINKVSELCCFDFYTNRNGDIDIRRFGDSGSIRELEITQSEILNPFEQTFNTAKLFYRYDVFHLDVNGNLSIVDNEISFNKIAQWDSMEAFRPVPNDGLLSQKIIYANESFARAMGELVLQTKSEGKYQINCQLKKTVHNTKYDYNINLYDVFRVDIDGVKRLMKVTGFEYNEMSLKYTKLTLEEL